MIFGHFFKQKIRKKEIIRDKLKDKIFNDIQTLFETKNKKERKRSIMAE